MLILLSNFDILPEKELVNIIKRFGNCQLYKTTNSFILKEDPGLKNDKKLINYFGVFIVKFSKFYIKVLLGYNIMPHPYALNKFQLDVTLLVTFCKYC